MKELIKEHFNMKRTSGKYLLSTTLGESVKAFVPAKLPPNDPPLSADCYLEECRAAEIALARLSGVTTLVPSIEWLLYGAIRKEALMTSQIEGTQATLTDLFDDEAGLTINNIDDIEEVTNYMAAFRYVRENLNDKNGLPISVRLLCNAHQLLLNGARGAGKQPGELRKSQNWIGGIKPSKAVFIPPPPQEVPKLLTNLEQFIHRESSELPKLVIIALAHAQFETIHPFLDGNGRIGRLLIAALLEHFELLPEPLMYLSSFLKEHQAEYYRLLNKIRSDGDWESWVSFFLEGVTVSANEAEKNIVDLATRVFLDRKKLLAYPNLTPVSLKLFDLLPMMPRFTIEHIKKELGTTFPTASAATKTLESLGIIVEVTGNHRNRSYSYQSYIDLLSK